MEYVAFLRHHVQMVLYDQCIVLLKCNYHVTCHISIMRIGRIIINRA